MGIFILGGFLGKPKHWQVKTRRVMLVLKTVMVLLFAKMVKKGNRTGDTVDTMLC